MSDGASSLISDLLFRLLEKLELDRDHFVRSLGYRRGKHFSRGRRRLDLWLDTGEGHDRILGQIADAYPDVADELQRARDETIRIRRAESQAAFLAECKAEEGKFAPFIYALGEVTVPRGITIFGITGGHGRWTVIHLPKPVLSLPLEEQLTLLPRFMLTYKRRHKGEVPFFGKLTGFRFVRLLDYFQFDAEASLVEHVERPFRPGPVYISVR